MGKVSSVTVRLQVGQTGSAVSCPDSADAQEKKKAFDVGKIDQSAETGLTKKCFSVSVTSEVFVTFPLESRLQWLLDKLVKLLAGFYAYCVTNVV